MFWVWYCWKKFLGQKFFWVPKFQGKNCRAKKFCEKNVRVRKKCLIQKKFGPRKLLFPKNFWVKKILGPKIDLGLKKMLVPKKFWGRKFFWSQKFEDFKKILGQRNLESEKFLDLKKGWYGPWTQVVMMTLVILSRVFQPRICHYVLPNIGLQTHASEPSPI